MKTLEVSKKYKYRKTSSVNLPKTNKKETSELNKRPVNKCFSFFPPPPFQQTVLGGWLGGLTNRIGQLLWTRVAVEPCWRHGLPHGFHLKLALRLKTSFLRGFDPEVLDDLLENSPIPDEEVIWALKTQQKESLTPKRNKVEVLTVAPMIELTCSHQARELRSIQNC